ncbi:MAG: trigger factor, partial [Candidatus Yanofskybacteria bacterium]|nr:trigger factor [Candidatus Yanofskybacteria bacterium]
NTAEKLQYTVKLHLYPTFTLPELEQFKVAKKEVQVEDSEINETLETVRNSRATFQDKEGTAEQGDRVEVDFNINVEGKPLEGGESKNHPLIIGGKSFIPGFEDQLVGMKKDEEKQFLLQAPKEYFHKDVAGKELDVKVKLNKVQSVTLPIIDDAFVKSLGSFTDLEQLKSSIREGIKQEKNSKEQQRVRLEVLDAIIKKADIEVPGELVKDQLDTMVANFDADLHRRGLELNMYLAHLGKTEEDMRKEWKPEAERQVKIVLILHKIARDHNITATNEEVDQAASELVQALVGRGEASLQEIDIDGVRRNIRDRLMNDKTLEFLEKTCIQ